jgi:hypothetical protein
VDARGTGQGDFRLKKYSQASQKPRLFPGLRVLFLETAQIWAARALLGWRQKGTGPAHSITSSTSERRSSEILTPSDFGGLEIDHELELGWLPDRQVRRLCAV